MVWPLLTLLALQQPEGRRYWTVPLDSLAAGRVTHTHVRMTGQLTAKHWEPDGDLHLRLTAASGAFVIAECIPTQCSPCKSLEAQGYFTLGKRVTVLGISRYDAIHKTWEVHPVESVIWVTP